MKFAGPIYDLSAKIDQCQTHDQIRRLLTDFLIRTQKVPRGALDGAREELLHLAVENRAPGKNRPRIRAIAEYVRVKIHPSVWVDLVEEQLRLYSPDHTILISDLRFPLEAQMCRDLGIYRLRIDVDPLIQKERMMLRGEAYTPETVNHLGECALDDYEYFSQRIRNDGSRDDLRSSLENLCERIIAATQFDQTVAHYTR